MKEEANLSWSALWPVVLEEKSWFGRIWEGPRYLALQQKEGQVSAPCRKGVQTQAVEAAVAAFWEWHLSALFCLSPPLL